MILLRIDIICTNREVNEEWCIEVPQGADPYEDQFQKRKADKKDRIAKNQKQQRNNQEAANKGNSSESLPTNRRSGKGRSAKGSAKGSSKGSIGKRRKTK